MHEGSRAISKARAPAGPEGVGGGEWGDQGARAKGLLPRGLRLVGLGGGEVTACAPAGLPGRPVKNNALPISPWPRVPFRNSLPTRLQRHDAPWNAHTLCLFLSSLPDKITLSIQTAKSATGSISTTGLGELGHRS